MTKSVLINDKFFAPANKLRQHFDRRFADPHKATAGRFIWDYWHVPGQYTTLRTPAYEFFPRAVYRQFHEQLVWWGRRNLGCHDVSPPWLSCYVDGCRQELHGDVPHGPWAFVFSLTPWEDREFRGGETIMLRDEMLRYWQDFRSNRGLERQNIFHEIPPLFNRLTVFDPRIPHGVTRVEGTNDPRKGRLVIHGWFVQPRPFIEGPLKEKVLQQVIEQLSEMLSGLFTQGLGAVGMLSLKFQVQANGTVRQCQTLSTSLRSTDGEALAVRALIDRIEKFIKRSKFSKSRSASWVTLPLLFER